MFYKLKNLNENIVDIKNHLNNILVNLIFILFPLNQQYHFRPFSSVEGVIIDYLIVKVSIPEILILSLFFINLKGILKIITDYFLSIWTLISLVLILNSVIRSSYIFLAIYENSLLIVAVLVGAFFYKNLNKINSKILILSIKIWILLLTILAISQFHYQSSVFDNYPLTGEFPYTEDHYHIKQKNVFFENLIPPYGIFSHSNIFGGYLLFLLVFLRVLKADSKVYYFFILTNLILIGSSACLLAFIFYILTLRLGKRYLILLIKFIFAASFGIYFLNSHLYELYSDDYSVYRRLYMYDLSSTHFLRDPIILFFGSGYYNYFNIVKSDLYSYELVRFFQPPHFSYYLFIWQYGLILLLSIVLLVVKYLNSATKELLSIYLIAVILFSFDHYILTNHQFKILLILLIPYSLNYKNSIK
jgi:hypothetical protein